jgi:hypothetical protein
VSPRPSPRPRSRLLNQCPKTLDRHHTLHSCPLSPRLSSPAGACPLVAKPSPHPQPFRSPQNAASRKCLGVRSTRYSPLVETAMATQLPPKRLPPVPSLVLALSLPLLCLPFLLGSLIHPSTATVRDSMAASASNLHPDPPVSCSATLAPQEPSNLTTEATSWS